MRIRHLAFRRNGIQSKRMIAMTLIMIARSDGDDEDDDDRWRPDNIAWVYLFIKF